MGAVDRKVLCLLPPTVTISFKYVCLDFSLHTQANPCDQQGDSHFSDLSLWPCSKNIGHIRRSLPRIHRKRGRSSSCRRDSSSHAPAYQNPDISYSMYIYINISQVVFFKVYVWGCSRQKTVLLTGVVTSKYIHTPKNISGCLLLDVDSMHICFIYT